MRLNDEWPRPLALEEYTHAAMANAYEAGACNLPFAVFRSHRGDLAGGQYEVSNACCARIPVKN